MKNAPDKFVSKTEACEKILLFNVIQALNTCNYQYDTPIIATNYCHYLKKIKNLLNKWEISFNLVKKCPIHYLVKESKDSIVFNQYAMQSLRKTNKLCEYIIYLNNDFELTSEFETVIETSRISRLPYEYQLSSVIFQKLGLNGQTNDGICSTEQLHALIRAKYVMEDIIKTFNE